MVQVAVLVAGIAAGLRSSTWRRAAMITVAVFIAVLVVQTILVASDESIGWIYWMVQVVSLAVGLAIARALVVRRGHQRATVHG
jgi:hypothetical protein